MAEDATESRHRRNRTCTRCKFSTPDGRAFLHHQLNAHSDKTFNEPHKQSAFDSRFKNVKKTPPCGSEQSPRRCSPRSLPSEAETLTPGDDALGWDTESEHEEEPPVGASGERPQPLNGSLVSRTYRCSECPSSTASPRQHLTHLVEKHGHVFTIYECDLCDYATKYKHKLPRHRRCHSHQYNIQQQQPTQVGASRQTRWTEKDMLGSPCGEHTSTREKDGFHSSPEGARRGGLKVSTAAVTAKHKMKDINENIKQQVQREFEPYLGCPEKMNTARAEQGDAAEEQDLLCDESVANDSAEFESSKRRTHRPARDGYDEGNDLIIDLGESSNQNQNNNNNNSNMDATPAILKAVSLANANTMVQLPMMVTPSLTLKREGTMEGRPPQQNVATTSTPNPGPKLTKKGTVPVREAVDPAKYVRLQDVDGVRYACSKCGNVYKWRKSLNKHWKEKHDGEIPVPASGSITMLNIPHIKGGGQQFSTTKSSASSGRTLVSPSVLSSSGAISSYALDQYIVDMGAQSGGRSIQSSYSTTSSAQGLAGTTATMGTRNLLGKQSFNSLLSKPQRSPTIPFTSVHHLPIAAPGVRLIKADSNSTPTTSTHLGRQVVGPQTVMPPLAHARGMMKHEVQNDDSCEDMPLDLSKKNKPASNILDLTAPSVSCSRPSSAVTNSEQPLDFSIKSNPGSERSTPISSATTSHSGLFDREDLPDQPWMRATSTPEAGVYANLQCYKCPFIARDKSSFEEHLEQHANYSQYPQCAQCKQHFSSNEELTQHFGLHHLHTLQQLEGGGPEDGSFGQVDSRPVPGSTPESRQLYQYLTHPKESRERKCVVCNANFPWQRDLARHFSQMHSDLPNPYKKRALESDCALGEGEPWHKVAKYERHSIQEARQTDTDLECEQCSFVARDACEMGRHLLVHSFNRPHACTMCGFSSKSREELTAHMWKYHPAHAEELALTPSGSGSKRPTTPTSTPGKNMPESIHGQNAADTSGSSAHSSEFNYDDVIIVTPNTTEVPLVRGRKSGKAGGPSSSAEILLPYKCSVCEYRARWPSEITQHMKNHSDEKPYHCPRCTYKSKWKWDVVKHLKRCGGGTVKDVIDTSRLSHKSEQTDTASSAAKQLQFRTSSPKQPSLSNGPPNVTVLPPASPHLQTDIPTGYESPRSSSSDIVPYPRDDASPDPGVAADSDVQTGRTRGSLSQNQSNQGLCHCRKCPFVGNSPAELKRHCRVHSDEKPFSCQTCGYSSKWKCDLKKHTRTYSHVAAPRSAQAEGNDTSGHNGQHSSSDEMSIDLTRAAEHGRSPRESSTPKPTLYKCEKCQYVTYKKNFLDGHMKIHRQGHEKSGKLKCKQCDFEASDLPSFLQHKLTHSSQQVSDASPNVEPLSNVDIEKTEREVSPTRHRRKPVKYLTCPKCPYTCTKPARLGVHEMMHGAGGPGTVSCEFCDYNVYNQPLLVQHMKLHPQFDDWCDRQEHTLEEDLQEEASYMDVDKTERMEKTQGSKVAAGAGKHTGQDGSDTVAGGMKLMVANPTESGPGFQCGKCAFITETRAHFELHIRQHGAGQRYECEHCDWSSVRLYMLYKHMREVHPQHLTLRDSSDGNSTSREGTPLLEDRSKGSGNEDARRKSSRFQTCAQCGYITDNAAKMSVHRAKHSADQERKCHYCSTSMKTEADMQKHLRSAHDVEVDDKDAVNLKTGSKKDADLSKPAEKAATRSSVPSEADSMDEAATKQLMNMKDHQLYVMQYGKRKVFCCPKCSYRTNNSSHCISHVKQHGSDKRYTCDYCDYSQAKLAPLFHHMKMCHSAEIDTTDTEGETEHSTGGRDEGLNGSTKESKSASASSAMDRHRCRRCPYSATSYESLKRHTEWHEYNGHFTCPACDYSVDSRDMLQQHRRLHQCPDPAIPMTTQGKTGVHPRYSLGRTSKSYKRPLSTTSAIARLISRRYLNIRYRCGRCPYSTLNRDRSLNHRRYHLVARKFKCPHCDFSASHYIRLKHHLSVHAEKGIPTETRNERMASRRKSESKTDFKCQECPYRAHKPLDLHNHSKWHGSNSKYHCNFCTFSVDRINQFKQHQRLHAGQGGNGNDMPSTLQLNTAHAAGKTALGLPKLRIVLRPIGQDLGLAGQEGSCEESSGKSFHCDLCPFVCKKRQSYTSHRRLHGAKGRLSCKHCNFRVNHVYLMQQHAVLHSAPSASVLTKRQTNGKRMSKRFKCTRCPYHTVNQALLDIHSKLHFVQDQEKGDIGSESELSKCYYKCSACPFQVNNKNKFESHTEQHRVRSPLSCPHCSFSSKCESDLELHMKVHCGDGPSESAVSLAPTSANISSYVRPTEPSNNNNKDTKKSTACQYCERDFADESERLRHERQHLIG